MQALGAPLQTLGVQHIIHLAGFGRRGKPARLVPLRSEGLRLLAAALEAGPMSGRQRRRLVEEEQLGVVAAPRVCAGGP